MSRLFEELAHEATPMGDISLRRRLEPELRIDVWEVILGDEFLMTSLFTTGEVALADIGLAAWAGSDLDVVVGGLGLGYTAQAALADDRVRSMVVVDALAPVIDWHRRHLTPLGAELTGDDRCRLVHGDFFAMVAHGDGLVDDGPATFDAILLDVDHSPRHHLHPSHAPFYEPDGLRRLTRLLKPGGVFALWSNDPTDDAFLATLETVFESARAETVTFPNFYQDRDATSTIYVGTV